MQYETYLFIKSAHEWYVGLEIRETNHNIPSSGTHMKIKLSKFVHQLIANYPGTIRDLTNVIEINPDVLVRLGKGQMHLAFIERHNNYRSVDKMIRLWYEYVLARNPTGD